ncbi:MAG: hypothetical protein N3I86_12995, partial [Verrucomicrobiae bacterium]|nr:hypothetical protein [Verrucomicrobiae bacterium]
MNIEQPTSNIEHRIGQGSARVSRAVFGVPPKTFLNANTQRRRGCGALERGVQGRLSGCWFTDFQAAERTRRQAAALQNAGALAVRSFGIPSPLRERA